MEDEFEYLQIKAEEEDDERRADEDAAAEAEALAEAWAHENPIDTEPRDKAVVNSFEVLLMAVAHRDVQKAFYLDCRQNANLEAKKIQREYGYAMDDLRAEREDLRQDVIDNGF